LPPTAVPFQGRPLARFTTTHFAGSGNCAMCHTALTDSAGNDVSIDTHWRSTMMANSAKDPFWLAQVRFEVAQNPGLKDIIEDKCATCHMPMARTQAHIDQQPISILDGGYLDPDHPLNTMAMDGVSCALCHQIQDANLGQEASFSGYYTIDAQTRAPDRLIYSPFPEPDPDMMQRTMGYKPVEGKHMLDSELCAVCHTLYTPYVDDGGNVLGLFPEQTPYLEWQRSVYGDGLERDTSCQECHMPAADGPTLTSNLITDPGAAHSPFAQHHFVGGNAFMLKLFKQHGDALGLTAGTAHLDATLARTIEQLTSRTAQVSVIDVQLDGETLNVTVEINSLAGHKFPTGFPSRRAWIHLVVVDGKGDVVFESGRPQANGAIAGNDADESAAGNQLRYEPHYDLISSADQVQIYESVMHNSDGEVTYALLRAASYAKDNRLLPRGFNKAGASDDIGVHGAAATDDTFSGGADQVTYQIAVKGHAGPFTLSVELLYQSIATPFIQNLGRQDGALIERMTQYYADADHTPVVIATVKETMP
jgi:hypothetical protein